jgi:hypothetical protein
MRRQGDTEVNFCKLIKILFLFFFDVIILYNIYIISINAMHRVGRMKSRCMHNENVNLIIIYMQDSIHQWRSSIRHLKWTIIQLFPADHSMYKCSNTIVLLHWSCISMRKKIKIKSFTSVVHCMWWTFNQDMHNEVVRCVRR